MTLSHENPFEIFFRNPVYLQFKNHLYNYRLRRSAIRRELESAGSGLTLEIGSGVSTMADGMPNVLFSDISQEAVRFLKEKKIADKAAAMSITQVALKNATVETVVCSEVLEHIPDDEAALRELYRVLKPGGKIILTVPVHPDYFAGDDRFVQHERRYAIKPFAKKLMQVGFNDLELVKITGFLDKLAMRLAVRIFKIMNPPGREKSQGAGSTDVLKLLLPFYKLGNILFAWLVSAEAKLLPLASSAVVLIRGTKKK